jgi:hypothetical protein
LIVGQIKLIDKLLICGGLFQGMEVNSMEVLHDRLLERETIVHVVLQEDGYELEFGNTGRSPTSFAGNKFILVRFTFHRSNDDGLEYSELRYRGGQRLEALVIEGFARLKLIRSN